MRGLLLIAFLSLSVVSAAVGQSTGRITGTVTDAAGASLAGINVYVEGSTLGAASNAEGVYQIEGVPVGTYTLVASGIGFRAQRQSVSVAAGATATVNVDPGEAVTCQVASSSTSASSASGKGCQWMSGRPVHRLVSKDAKHRRA